MQFGKADNDASRVVSQAEHTCLRFTSPKRIATSSAVPNTHKIG